MQNQTLTWIHLSDLHMEQQDTFNRSVVLEALWQDIESFVTRGFQPDFIAITGDIAYHGATPEYDLAIEDFFAPLLAVAKISKDRLFVVPGNHDVNRKRTDRLRNPIPAIQTEDDIRKLLESPDERELLLSPFSGYTDFVESYLPPYQEPDSLSFAHSHRFEKGDFLVSVVGLNSAWLSGFHQDTDGNVRDFGKLAIGEFQTRAALPSDAHLTIALVHHSFEWLMEVDRIVVEDILMNNCSIVLRGHLHRPEVLVVSSLAGDLLVIPSGAVFDTRNSPNAYNIVQVDLNSGTGTVYLRRYNDRRNEWQKDIESTGEKADGKFNFRLPKFWWAAAVETAGPEVSGDLRDYTCVFTNDCKRDISSLGLTEDDVIALVQGEFRSHLNYFRFDLEDYPLPVRTNYIVYLDKVQHRIEFRRVIPCTKNEAKLSSWNDILAVYRRATRMAYRTDPTKLLFVRGMIGRVINLHHDIETRIEKHYERFHGVVVHPGLRLVRESLEIPDEEREGRETVPAKVESPNRMGDEIAFHISASSSARNEALEVVKSMDAGDINDGDAVGIVVTAFERSLQHLHKIILRYPPVDEWA